MAFSFDIDLKDVSQAIAKAKSEIENAGGKFFGDASGGTFAAKKSMMEVKGNYAVSGNVAKITIEKKPAIVTEKKIKEEVRKFFA